MADLNCTDVCTMLLADGRGRKANGSAVRHASSSGAAAATAPLACAAAAAFGAAGLGALTCDEMCCGIASVQDQVEIEQP